MDGWPPILVAVVWILALVITAGPAWLGYRRRRAEPAQAAIVAADLMGTREVAEIAEHLRSMDKSLGHLTEAVERHEKTLARSAEDIARAIARRDK